MRRPELSIPACTLRQKTETPVTGSQSKSHALRSPEPTSDPKPKVQEQRQAKDAERTDELQHESLLGVFSSTLGGGGAGRQVIGTDRSVHEHSDRKLRELNMRVCYSDHKPTHVEEHKL